LNSNSITVARTYNYNFESTDHAWPWIKQPEEKEEEEVRNPTILDFLPAKIMLVVNAGAENKKDASFERTKYSSSSPETTGGAMTCRRKVRIKSRRRPPVELMPTPNAEKNGNDADISNIAQGINKSCQLLDFNQIPGHLRFNKYVLTHYRPATNWIGCLKSLFYLHNETVNILTHGKLKAATKEEEDAF
jgi:hypothetical protein